MPKPAKQPADIPASAIAAKWMLDARAVANALVETAIEQAARHDKVDPKGYAFDPKIGAWRHLSTLQPPPSAAPGKVG